MYKSKFFFIMNPSHHKYEGGCLLRTVRLWLIDVSVRKPTVIEQLLFKLMFYGIFLQGSQLGVVVEH